jgi:hypothetical protein
MYDHDVPGDIQLVIEGEPKAALGFLRGVFVGAGIADWPLPNAEHGIENESLGEALAEWVGAREHTTRVVIAAPSWETVRDAFADPRARSGRVLSARPIEEAAFDYAFAAYSEPYGDVVRGIFEAPPAPVRSDRVDWVETRREDAGATELYAPVHEYEFHGRGTVRGPLRDVLALHDRARRCEPVDERAIRLVLGEEIAG